MSDKCEHYQSENLVHQHELRFTLANHKKRLIEKFGKCTYCESTKELTLDHIIPKKLGGNSTQSNLTLACLTCNQRKAHKDIQRWCREVEMTLEEIFENRIIDKKETPIGEVPFVDFNILGIIY
jgi:5-methylcytosine-specific restriction endonuclease McrA